MAKPVSQLTGMRHRPGDKIGALAGGQRAPVVQAQRPGAVGRHAAQRFFGRQAEQGAGHVQHQQR